MNGPHHRHIRKRIYKNLERYPHPKTFVRALDWAVYSAGFLGPLLTVPQVYLIYVLHQASGVSVLSWTAYAILDIPWIVYGMVHREPVISFTYTLWLIVNLIVVVGALIYG